ncbi:enoyl-CoA hydratase/isomerase family protein [Cordyceps fumosorosea ARSEF 2679]|uniref:Enoyl-CoA hydratase/isomerase family protein n=1 Tax=Cordyceps fumosorosea (strain ARSEF 2679) TaxID=1081104 RepID=A0A168B7F9_CORFA|nr:enoyl-CoA hydratase/isomerase family protein [Cordyceps fumosorosea ARSEF 2679]OAA69727.1 enoyl-CoA hydratase/isomerase family protein [Cordyceps fumosorosea ARSEF 2679]
MTDCFTPELVLSSTPAPGVRLLRFNRPEKRNALSQPLIRAFLSELRNASADKDIFSIIITGIGPFFCAGADLNDIANLDEAGARATRYLEDLCAGFASVTKPIIAAVNGPASDFIVSAKSAYFVLPETTIGLIPGAGGTQRLTVAIGKYKVGFFNGRPCAVDARRANHFGQAMCSILLAQPMTADEAMAASLVVSVVSPDTLTQYCLEMASKFTAGNRQAIAYAKQAICRADDLCRDDAFERNLYYSTFGTDEKRRGVDDFLAARRKKA